MNFSFANPMYLWGFLSLLAPIGIHLLNRSKGKVILVGSVKWINAHDQPRSRNIKLNEIVLLILRCLTLCLLVFIVSQPKIHRSGIFGKGKLVLIEDRLDSVKQFRLMLDTIRSDHNEMRYVSGYSVTNYFSILEDVDKENKWDEVDLFTYGYEKNFHGPFPSIHYKLNIYAVPVDNSLESIVAIRKFSMDSLFVISQKLTGNNLSTQSYPMLISEFVNRSKLQSIRLPELVDEISSAIVFDEPTNQDIINWERILKSIEKQPYYNFRYLGSFHSGNLSVNADWVIRIGNREMDNMKRPTGGTIFYKSGSLENNGAPILIPTGKNSFELRADITPKGIYEEELLKKLFILFYQDIYYSEEWKSSDYRQMAQFPAETSIQSKEMAVVEYTWPLWILFFVTMMVERFVSAKRKQ